MAIAGKEEIPLMDKCEPYILLNGSYAQLHYPMLQQTSPWDHTRLTYLVRSSPSSNLPLQSLSSFSGIVRVGEASPENWISRISESRQRWRKRSYPPSSHPSSAWYGSQFSATWNDTNRRVQGGIAFAVSFKTLSLGAAG